MLPQRLAARGLRLTRARPTNFFSGSTLNNAARTVQKRTAASEAISASSADSILASQRLHRPISPHLSIYQPQLTWYLSMLNRITGVALSGGLYIFAIGYLFNIVDTASLVSAMAGLGVATKAAIKATIAFPFAFHSWNGIRHLVWDSAKELSVKGVYRTGYTVLGLTAVSTIYLAFV